MISILAKFIRRTKRRGSSDLTVNMLLTAAGAAMVGMTVPSLMKSSNTASQTFDKQVQILQRGAGGGAGTPSAGGSTPGFDFGQIGSIASQIQSTVSSLGSSSTSSTDTSSLGATSGVTASAPAAPAGGTTASGTPAAGGGGVSATPAGGGGTVSGAAPGGGTVSGSIQKTNPSIVRR